MMKRKLIKQQEALISQVAEHWSDTNHEINTKLGSIPREQMPSTSKIIEVIGLLKEILFPNYFAQSQINITSHLNKAFCGLKEQINCCIRLEQGYPKSGIDSEKKSLEIVSEFLKFLPNLQKVIFLDIQSAYNGDPAARNLSEIILSYPSTQAMIHYRLAHELYYLEAPIIPRFFTEIAHSITGIDIHPGAKIGSHFFIDHGSGTVIGETCEIGNNVKLYQGVTLGAKKFPLDEKGNPIKGIPRHPIIEDNVVIYAGATILGRVTIGRNSTIGGNVWLTHDVPKGSQVMQRKPHERFFQEGSGI